MRRRLSLCRPVLHILLARDVIFAHDVALQVAQARDGGFRVEVHAIGDWALASVLDALEATGITPADRAIVTHCQVRCGALRCVCSSFCFGGDGDVTFDGSSEACIPVKHYFCFCFLRSRKARTRE